MFQIGDVVRVVYSMPNDKIEKGAIAKIVDGKKCFPKYWDQLKQPKFMPCSQQLESMQDKFLWCFQQCQTYPHQLCSSLFHV